MRVQQADSGALASTRAAILFLVNRSDCHSFRPCDESTALIATPSAHVMRRALCLQGVLKERKGKLMSAGVVVVAYADVTERDPPGGGVPHGTAVPVYRSQSSSEVDAKWPSQAIA
eukprot:gene27176-2415_t